MKFKGLLFFLVLPAIAADLPGSQDPPLMKRYAGSEIIGYRAPKFDEYLMPLGEPTSQDPPAYKKSQKVEGHLRCTGGPHAGRSLSQLSARVPTNESCHDV